MTLVRWEPVRERSTLQHEINRLFGGFFDQPASAPTVGGGLRRQWIPPIDLVQSDGTYILRADLPGLASDDVKIELDDNVLTISGERSTAQEQHAGGYHRFERASGSFARALTLPAGVDAEAIEATFADGVLEVRIPAPQQAKPRRVTITTPAAGDSAAASVTERAEETTSTDAVAAAA
jgi:HSP20 family protein